MKLWIIIIIIIVVKSISYADEKWKDINDVTNILKASEAQLPDMKIKYTFTYYGTDNGKDMIKLIDSGIYACKKPEGLIMIDKAKTKFDTAGNSKIIWDTYASFNGKATFYLDRKKRAYDIMMANIEPGYMQTLIDAKDNPDWSIWRIGRTHISDFLKDHSTKIQIISEEIIQNEKTVKLQCSNTDSNSIDFILWISPEKDFLPIKYQWILKDYGRIFERTLCDLFQLNNGRWYPRKIIVGDKKNGWLMNIDNIDTNSIPKEFFTLKFPPNTHVTDHIVGTTYMIDATISGFNVDSDVLLSSPKDYSKNTEKVLDNYLKNGVCSSQKATETHKSCEIQTTSNDSFAKNIGKTERKDKDYKYFYIIIASSLLVVISIIFVIKKRASK